MSEMSPFGSEQDLFFMECALEQARIAQSQDEVPVGAVIVNPSGQIIGSAYNQVEGQYTQGAHAEMRALAHAGAYQKNWRLNGCWLYVTLEPCSMCMWSARLSRIDGILYGAPSPLFGNQLDNLPRSRVYKKDLLIIGGVKEAESAQILRQFFRKKRNSDGE